MSPEAWLLCVSCAWAASLQLQRGMPNVRLEQELTTVGQQQSCVQAFTQVVKMWKQGCTGHRWCMGYERRMGYYTVYKQVYIMEHKTVYKCCPGWTQQDDEPGCLHLLCSVGTCFNGRKCSDRGSLMCQCPEGFQGPRCQYGPLPNGPDPGPITENGMIPTEDNGLWIRALRSNWIQM